MIKRFGQKLADEIWSSWLSLLLFLLFLLLVFYVLSPFECPVRRALGFPLSRSEDVATGIHEGAWEQDCEAKAVKP